MKCAAIIVAAGKGERAGAVLPKQYAPLAGKAVLTYSVEACLSHPKISATFVVIGEGQEILAEEALRGLSVTDIVTGGAERQISVRQGLARAQGFDAVLIHDAARPFLPASVIDRLIEALAQPGCAGAVPVLPVVDTVARAQGSLGDGVDRTGLVRVQTPQAFPLPVIIAAHDAWSGAAATDDAQMVRAMGGEVRLVDGDIMLEKITQPTDFAEAERRLHMRFVSRTGMGFDVHRLQSDEELWLGGVLIPHHKGLAGHSDADVALHALTDALLGALGDGDIGAHFPPSDPQWRGAASHRFVEHAAHLVRHAGGIIDHVDLTLICEAPKIGPYREAMRTQIAAMLGVRIACVSVKATTTERLGFTGRGEGIAAQAVATIRLPLEH